MAYIFWFQKTVVYKTPRKGTFGSPLSSDSTTLSSNTFEVSNIYNCHIIDVYLFKCILVVCCFLINAFKAISLLIIKN